jgi:hypothetical protein
MEEQPHRFGVIRNRAHKNGFEIVDDRRDHFRWNAENKKSLL